MQTGDRRSSADGTPDASGVDRGAEQRCAAERRLYRTREAAQLSGVTRRQLQYWARTGLVPPGHRTPGGHHRYTFRDLVALRAARRLLDAGISLQRIRNTVAALRETLPRVWRPLSELVLVATGDVVLVFGEDTVFEAVSGQEWILEVGRFARELEAHPSRTEHADGAQLRRVRRTQQRRRTA